MSRLRDSRRFSQGFCGACAALDGYGKNRSENGVSSRQNRPAAGTAFGSGDGGRNTSDESALGSGKAVNPYTWLVCAKTVKIDRGEGESTQDSMFSAGHKPTQGRAFGEGRGAQCHPRQCFRCRALAHPRQCFRCGARAHPNSACGAGHEPIQIDPWDRRGGSAQPAGP